MSTCLVNNLKKMGQSSLLLGSLMAILMVNTHAESKTVTVEYVASLGHRGIPADKLPESSPPGPVTETPLHPYFEEGCVLHGVDDFLRNHSYFFCIDLAGFQFTFSEEGGDYEGLDYNGSHLFASAGDDTNVPGDILEIMPLADCGAAPIAHLGPVMIIDQAMEEVDGIAFNDGGDMVGWAQEAGLFWVPAAHLATSPIEGKLVFEQPGEVEDLEMVNDCVIGLLNIDHMGQMEDGDSEPHQAHQGKSEDVNVALNGANVVAANYIVACPAPSGGTWTLSTPCEPEVTEALQTYQASEIEAIEVLPPLPGDEGLKVLLGFHTRSEIVPNNALVLGILDVDNCTLTTQEIYDVPENPFGDQLDVEGLAMICPTE